MCDCGSGGGGAAAPGCTSSPGLAAGTLIIAGGIGNIVDRVRLGYVVDMFHFQFWPSYPVFNVADICIVTGAVLGVIYYLWIYERFDQKRSEPPWRR